MNAEIHVSSRPEIRPETIEAAMRRGREARAQAVREFFAKRLIRGSLAKLVAAARQSVHRDCRTTAVCKV